MSNANVLNSSTATWLRTTWKTLKKQRQLQYLVLPGLLYFVIFHYLPIYGLAIAFKDFNGKLGILGSPGVGFKHFISFFNYPYFFRIVKNTFLLSAYDLLFAFPAPIILALLLNEVKNVPYRRAVQTISFLPHFLSVVAVIGIFHLLLSPITGYVNVILRDVFHQQPIYFMANSAWFRPVFIVSGIWQDVGWGAIIYLAAISGIDEEMYEAAVIDGASRIRRIWHITLPSIRPTIAILLILRVGRLLSVSFEKVLLMYSPVIYDVSDVISTFLFRRGLLDGDYSFGAAVGLFNSIVNVVLLLLANAISKRVADESVF